MVRLGRVERLRVVAQVLRGEEHAEREPTEEVARRQVAGDRPDREARARCQSGNTEWELEVYKFKRRWMWSDRAEGRANL